VKDELSITPALDVALTWLREQTVWVLATPITWLYCNCGVRSFKEKRTQQIEAGVETVIAIQKRCRTPFLDVYFTAWSFCAEEEFYLLVLPLLFWNVDVFYARHLTFVITVGLFVGNLYKDLFELPRPINISNTKMSRKVWSPKSVTAIDTTACKDYGFPSTHSMNAVSNSLFTVMYLYLGSGTFAWGPTTTFPFVLAMACAMIWMVSLIVGRLYLGVHSPTDVRGGILLGLVIACGGHLLSGPLDLYIKTAQVEFDDKIAQSVATHLAPLATAMGSSVITVLFLVIILVLHPQVRVCLSLSLSLCVCVSRASAALAARAIAIALTAPSPHLSSPSPHYTQPRPQTPTFLLNSLLAGLISGTVHGSRVFLKRGWNDPTVLAEGAGAVVGLAGSSVYAPLIENWWSLVTVRTVVGYVCLLLLRQLCKTGMHICFKACGINARKGAGKGLAKDENVRGIDLAAASATKAVTNHMLAFYITFLYFIVARGCALLDAPVPVEL
jgi:membrane-associated phospholipid phosphatase